jgi:hypothetical protein
MLIRRVIVWAWRSAWMTWLGRRLPQPIVGLERRLLKGAERAKPTHLPLWHAIDNGYFPHVGIELVHNFTS